MLVFVLNKHGKPLMPCHSAKSRLLLKQGQAKVVKRTPFTIQLLYGSSGYKQPVTLGVDSGYNSLGLSAVTKKQELYTAEVRLRGDIVKLNSERRQYRRGRRSRKTWYRKPRFLNRKKSKAEGWLAPSIQHKLDTHLKVINQVKEILPISKINIEVAAFDIQKLKNPNISGIEYQNGVQKNFCNVRAYVLYRDGHLCQHCKGKSRDAVLEIHHIVSRQIGGDRPDNLITLCSTCHKKVSKGELKLKLNIKSSNSDSDSDSNSNSNGFKTETFMTQVRRRIVDNLRLGLGLGGVGDIGDIGDIGGVGGIVSHTYGYLTKEVRQILGIPKSHVNDAFVIAGGKGQKRIAVSYLTQQVRKCNRKLFKGARSHIRNSSERLVKGFQRFDKVLWHGVECFVFGRRTSGYFELRKLDGTKISSSAKVAELTLLERAKTLLVEIERLKGERRKENGFLPD